MSYILYSPEHEIVRPAIRRKDGTQIPEKIFKTGERALYRLKGLPDRRYRSDYPKPNYKDMYLAEFETLDEAIQEQGALEAYSGEKFEIREYEDGKLGMKISYFDYRRL